MSENQFTIRFDPQAPKAQPWLQAAMRGPFPASLRWILTGAYGKEFFYLADEGDGLAIRSWDENLGVSPSPLTIEPSAATRQRHDEQRLGMAWATRLTHDLATAMGIEIEHRGWDGSLVRPELWIKANGTAVPITFDMEDLADLNFAAMRETIKSALQTLPPR